jgi:hypothetical protein
MIVWLAVRWSWLKVDLGTVTGISADLLHVYVGMLLFLLPRLVSRGRLSLGRSWWTLVALECVNEALDLSRPPGSAESDIRSSLHDLANTMALPSLVWISQRQLAGRAAAYRETRKARTRSAKTRR